MFKIIFFSIDSLLYCTLSNSNGIVKFDDNTTTFKIAFLSALLENSDLNTFRPPFPLPGTPPLSLCGFAEVGTGQFFKLRQQ